MAKRRVRRVVRFRLIIIVVVMMAIGFLYSWAPFPYQTEVMAAAGKNALNPYLVAAVIRVESRFRPAVVSRRGAVGLMQLMPTTGDWIARKMQWTTVPPLTHPSTNIALGTWYLNYLKARFNNNMTLTLAAYNGGPETVDRWLQSGVLSPSQRSFNPIPYPETRNFVRRVKDFERAYAVMYFWLRFSKHFPRGVVSTAKVMSEETKLKLSERLGIDDIVRQEGWGGVPARQCGNLVREAIRLAEEELART